MRAIIACAGTGGHINPGIAIASIIKEQEMVNHMNLVSIIEIYIH